MKKNSHKNLKPFINIEFYSKFNEKIELNLKVRYLNYFSNNRNPILDTSYSDTPKKVKRRKKEIYNGGYLKSSSKKRKELKLRSIFDPNTYLTEPEGTSDENIKNKILKRNKSYKYVIHPSFKPVKIFNDYAIEFPFKYNINYSSISKKIPTVNLNPKRYAPEIRKKIAENEQKRKNLTLNLLQVKKDENKDKKIEIKKCKIPFGKLQKKVFKSKGNINLKKNRNKNNHALSFDNYLSREKLEMIKNKSSKDNGILTYLKPYNIAKHNKHKIVNYKKMKSWNEIVNNNIHYYETIDYLYKPKYTLIDGHIPEIIFNPKDKIKKGQKKIKLRRVLSSYKMTEKFEMIDDTKLIKNISLKDKVSIETPYKKLWLCKTLN